MTFSDFGEKISFLPFWPKNGKKKGHFGPKTAILTNLSNSSHEIFLIFLIETQFWSLKNGQNNFLPKNLNFPFLVQFFSFRPKNGHYSKSVHKILLFFPIQTNFLVLKEMAKKKFPGKISFLFCLCCTIKGCLDS